MKLHVRMFSVLIFLLATLPVNATPLIANGGFEAGLTGWVVTDQAGGSGSWFAAGPGLTPLTLLPTVGPAAGALYAVTDQTGPGAHTLIQSFTVSGTGTVLLSFEMFVHDWSGYGPFVDPAGLDYTAGPNQHARVDILSAGAGAFDTGAGVLATYYLGIDPFPTDSIPNPYTHYSFDVTSVVGGGGTYQLRFAEVDNQLYLNMGVDNVNVDFTPGVPEPATLTLMGAGLVFLASRLRRLGA